jgi:hypothetical protein
MLLFPSQLLFFLLVHLFLIFLVELSSFLFSLFIIFLYYPSSSFFPSLSSMLSLRTSILDVPLLCTPLLHFLISFSAAHLLHTWDFPQKCIQNYLSNRPPTLTCGSSQAIHVSCVTLFHTSMNFWEASLVAATSFVTSSSFPKISSTTCIVRVVIFSFISCGAFFVVPFLVANSMITLSY